MIIGFYGLPGSGKTTIVRQLATYPGWTYVSLSGKFEVLSYFLWGSIRHPVIFTSAFFHYFTLNKSLFYLWNFYVVQYAKYQKAQSLSRKNKYVLLDEGPLQNIISYPNAALTESELMIYLNIIPRTDKTIVFAINEQERKRRLRERVHHQSWRKEHSDDEDWDVYMLETDTLFKKLVATDVSYYVTPPDSSCESIAAMLVK